MSRYSAEIHRRRHRTQKRNKLRAQLAAAPVVARAAIEAKLQKTYGFGAGPQPLTAPVLTAHEPPPHKAKA